MYFGRIYMGFFLNAIITMKKYILLAVSFFAAATAFAQDDLNTASDALRYTDDDMNGTARFRSMSGAFGALGGDLSAIMINPAGSAVFSYNSGTVSFTYYNTGNKASYFGNNTKTNDNSLDLNQIGAVFVFNNSNPDAFMNKFTLGFNYENTNNFDNSIYYSGINPSNSIDKYFLNYANGIGTQGGIPLSVLNSADYRYLNFADQQAYLGYNAYIFNPESPDPNNTRYETNVPGGSYYQQNFIETNGYNGKIAFNFGTQLKKRFYLGLNLNMHFSDYIKDYSIFENYNSSSGLQNVQFNNRRYTYGGGFSFNLGGIAKITEALRLGVAYESPTWMNLQDEISQSIVTNCPDCEDGNLIINDPGVTFILDDYTIKSPSKYTGSLAYIFGQSGLISIDYSFRDYGNTKYTSSRYNIINEELSSTLRLAGELRVGGEYRIKNFSVRGGYRFEQSPYKNKQTVGNLNGFSTGLGFAFGNSKIDLSYAYFNRKYDVSLLPTVPSGITDSGRINSNNNNITLSLTMDL